MQEREGKGNRGENEPVPVCVWEISDSPPPGHTRMWAMHKIYLLSPGESLTAWCGCFQEALNDGSWRGLRSWIKQDSIETNVNPCQERPLLGPVARGAPLDHAEPVALLHSRERVVLRPEMIFDYCPRGDLQGIEEEGQGRRLLLSAERDFLQLAWGWGLSSVCVRPFP